MKDIKELVDDDLENPCPHFLVLFLSFGPMAIWPLLSIFFIVRASASGNTSSKNGAVRSLKLYVLWVVVVVTPMAYVAVTFNGIV